MSTTETVAEIVLRQMREMREGVPSTVTTEEREMVERWAVNAHLRDAMRLVYTPEAYRQMFGRDL